MQFPDTHSQTQLPCRVEAQVIWRNCMNAVWGTAAIQPSLQVIPTQVPDISEDIPDDSSPQSFPGCTLIKFLTLRTCEQSKVIFFYTKFWDDDTEAQRDSGISGCSRVNDGTRLFSSSQQPSVHSSFHYLLLNKCLFFSSEPHTTGALETRSSDACLSS